MSKEKPDELKPTDKFIYFVDNKEYSTDKPSLTGQDIKEMAKVPGEYQLYLEEEGDDPDRAIPDSETIDLVKSVKHFYAVPPATFGRS